MTSQYGRVYGKLYNWFKIQSLEMPSFLKMVLLAQNLKNLLDQKVCMDFKHFLKDAVNRNV